ncbi:MAG: TonB family protein [Stenotrophomonas sp.]
MSRPLSSGLRWSGSFVVAVMLHALVICVALLCSLERSPLLADEQPLEAVMVELAEVPEAPSEAATEIPPGPRQQEQQRSEPEPAPKPRESLPEDLVSEVSEPHTSPKSSEQDKASNQVNVEQTLAPPQANARSSERYAAIQTTAGLQSQVVVTWQGTLLGHLEKFRRYPRLSERRRDEGVVYVRFSVDRQGNATNVRIGRSSGHEALDQATLETVSRATPMPAPPPEISGDPVEVMVPVQFFIKRR